MNDSEELFLIVVLFDDAMSVTPYNLQKIVILS